MVMIKCFDHTTFDYRAVFPFDVTEVWMRFFSFIFTACVKVTPFLDEKRTTEIYNRTEKNNGKGLLQKNYALCYSSTSALNFF